MVSTRGKTNRTSGSADSAFCSPLGFFWEAPERPDIRRDYGEERIIAIGRIGSDVLSVVYTWRTDEDGTAMRWIISAQLASRGERRVYAAFFP
ncbi:BrnT family toxin [Azospirillum oleiclasticum]|uniref:BrnT family toxin n=1 Tax=Azospirillum oleiclasticum TaxID=2735135 RepID=UPI001FE394D4|nr:BrnT family toxin [Azospirillum oleiclasticum]